jgi:methyl-accepting chemotaxis protein
MWTVGRKIAAGFALSFVLLAAIGVVAYRSIGSLTKTSELVAHTHVVLERVATLDSLMKDAETGQRGFVIAGDEAFLEPHRDAVARIPTVVSELRALTKDNARQQDRLTQAEGAMNQKLAELSGTIELRRKSGFEPTQKIVQAGEGKRAMDGLRSVLDAMEQEERELLVVRAAEADSAANEARTTIIVGTLLCLVVASMAGFSITRSLTTQIGSAVQHVRSSSAELESVAGQQVSGAKESSSATQAISTTMSELLVSSRQIADSARRVAQIAEETSTAAKVGDKTVQSATDSVGGIQRQVDLIVNYMLDLGKKSRQIDGILELITELADQTNILAVNANIEAAGAGDAGARFGVVASEIRKLADRVGGSTKEVRALLDDVRGAVNTTVMATEGGSKAVDAGARQFVEVNVALQQIVSLVGTTSAAAREIELSTKQQSTAVEQITFAINNVAQANKETEASATQTLQTASELSGLSRKLMQLVEASPGA